MKKIEDIAGLLHVLLLITALLCGGALSMPYAAADEGLTAPTDPATIALGQEKYGAKCGGFCHGSGGKGGRAPCLICGKFKRGGTDAELVANITNGVKGTAMGAFGEVYSQDEIVAIVAYLRSEQKKKEAEGN